MLFDDNFGFPNIEVYPPKQETKIVSNELGFNRGNMFKDEYIPYKNYNPGLIKTTNNQEKQLLDILELCFKKVDLNLYLDLNPNDQELLEEFKNCLQELAMKESEYVKTYGPLELMDSTSTNAFTWINNPWPWEVGGKNV